MSAANLDETATAAAGEPSSIASRAALGSMPSMDPRCTPAKHRYDACFNAWFEDYLGLSSSSSTSSTAAAAGASSSQAGNAKAKSSFFGGSSGRSKETGEGATQAAAGGNRQQQRERLEGQCGPLWKEYQACIERAVGEKNLGGLIEEARMHNPFPFPQDRDPLRPNSEPFPFPSGSSKS